MTDDSRKKLIAILRKSKALNLTHVEALADAIIDGLRREGLSIVDEDDIIDEDSQGTHLRVLKTIRKKLEDAINDPEIPARDLAAVTNRQIAVSREVTSIEEKLSAEKRTSGSSSSNGQTKAAKTGSAVDI